MHDIFGAYRAQMISDVVTGKVDVHSIEVPKISGEETLDMDENVDELQGIENEALEVEE